MAHTAAADGLTTLASDATQSTLMAPVSDDDMEIDIFDKSRPRVKSKLKPGAIDLDGLEDGGDNFYDNLEAFGKSA